MVTDALTLLNRKRVIDYALVHRIPAMYEASLLVQDGGLMSYGANQDDNFRRAAIYVDRIFKGASPSSLPVERPARYYLTINFKTSKALGLTIPPSLLQRADQVIEAASNGRCRYTGNARKKIQDYTHRRRTYVLE